MFTNSNPNPLFGGSAAQGGMFAGAKPQTAGLFGQQAQPTAGGGIFAQPQPQGGTPIGTNLFGGGQQAQPQAGTSLFGGGGNKPPMFSGGGQQPQPGMTTNPAQPAPNQMFPNPAGQQGGASQGQAPAQTMFGGATTAGQSAGMFSQPKPQQPTTNQPMTGKILLRKLIKLNRGANVRRRC